MRYGLQGSGLESYSYAVATDPTELFNFPDGMNNWSVEEQETSGAGTSVQSVVTTFSNFDGDALLSDTWNGGTSAHWVTYSTYDQYANVHETAQPSAVDTGGPGYTDSLGYSEYGYNSSGAGLNINLYPSSGMIDVYTYYADSNTDPSAASMAGLPDETGVAQGNNQVDNFAMGSAYGPILQTSTAYMTDAFDGTTSFYTSRLHPVPKRRRQRRGDHQLQLHLLPRQRGDRFGNRERD